MVKKLVTKAAFAKLAGVTPAAITKAVGKALSPAIEGKRINAAHPAAVAYLEEQAAKADQPPSPATGIDPLYEDAIVACQAAGRCSTSVLRKALKVGSTRASALQSLIKAAGVEFDIRATVPPRVDQKPAVKQKSPPPDMVDDPLSDMPEEIAAVADMTIRDVVQRYGTVTAFKDWLSALKSIEDIREKRIKNAEREGKLIPRDLVESHIVAQFERVHIELMTDGAQTMAARLEAMFASGTEAPEAQKFISGTISKAVRSAKSTIARVLRNA